MARFSAAGSGGQIAKALAFGAVTLILYVCLFLMERPILELSTRGGWYFVLPVAIAFAVSFAHGTFTGYFWDLLGVKAKK